ncbi:MULTISPECIES: glycerophosphodiester phosphodiesterase [unclassified Sphingobium]|uniref:glycerophosphodiester phosphodiesterase n=1 Tax=unclassified Sphingobium TaxID=2611147 RepID=UPI000770074C|nr:MULTISPECIES: glycerophosphodiester phosphodiesterase [unclassified Sphingobium]AMK24558.1 glycerophosphoryl diester phosphodiesterase [Sphingobium sp. TKS]NML88574.1 glycerophosphodiester phosphodiesterase [Sphingobium sp. TB-6]
MIFGRMLRTAAILLLALLTAAPVMAEPFIIAHRGASGERPEHTLAAYERAIDQGADYIEPDLVLTRDGVLVARHENEISGTTDVADHPEFAARKTSKTIDGQPVTGWFTEDFTLAELRTLRARERLPQFRAANSRFNDLYPIPTFEEILKLVRAKEAETGRRIGLYPETKHPSYFAGIGLAHQAPLLALLSQYGYQTEADPVFIQSFEVGNLKALRAVSRLRLIQLVEGEGGPADAPGTTYADMMTTQGLKQIADYADGIGPATAMVLAPEGPTGLVGRAHDAGLQVHVWTLRMENSFLPAAFQRPDDPQGRGDFAGYVQAVARTGVDAMFSDFPKQAREALNPAP